MPDTAREAQSHRTRVLLVDYNQAFLRVATDLLERDGGLVVVGAISSKGEDVLAQSQALRPQVIMVGLDAPELAGLKLVSRLRIALPDVRIVGLTMLNGAAYREAALSAGADEVVTKANLSTDLLPAIRQIFQTDWHDRQQFSL